MRVKARVDKVPDVLFHVVIHWIRTKFLGHNDGAFLIDCRILLKQEFYEADKCTICGQFLPFYLVLELQQ